MGREAARPFDSSAFPLHILTWRLSAPKSVVTSPACAVVPVAGVVGAARLRVVRCVQACLISSGLSSFCCFLSFVIYAGVYNSKKENSKGSYGGGFGLILWGACRRCTHREVLCAFRLCGVVCGVGLGPCLALVRRVRPIVAPLPCVREMPSDAILL